VTRQPSLAQRELEQLDRVFNALAHQSRRTILSVLNARGGSMTSRQIADRFECTWPTTTRHLRVLEDAGLVRIEVTGRERHYQLNAAMLKSTASQWLQRLTGQPS
jgi:DNA-binding transcriptional ArsR family regulator